MPEPGATATGAIRQRIKELIGDIASIDPGEIADDARLVEDLELDSLSLLEVGVDVDYEYRLDVSDERLKELRSIEDCVELVQSTLTAKALADGTS